MHGIPSWTIMQTTVPKNGEKRKREKEIENKNLFLRVRQKGYGKWKADDIGGRNVHRWNVEYIVRLQLNHKQLCNQYLILKTLKAIKSTIFLLI